jgi:hypothetical protein
MFQAGSGSSQGVRYKLGHVTGDYVRIAPIATKFYSDQVRVAAQYVAMGHIQTFPKMTR